MKALKIVLATSLLLNCVAIPCLTWKLVALDSMYRRNVDYCAELAYVVGYTKAKGGDMKTTLDRYPTRLSIATAQTDLVEALIWPARREYIRMEFRNVGDDSICDAELFNKIE